MEFFNYKMSFQISEHLLRPNFFSIKVILFHVIAKPKRLMNFKEKMAVFYDNLNAKGR